MADSTADATLARTGTPGSGAVAAVCAQAPPGTVAAISPSGKVRSSLFGFP